MDSYSVLARYMKQFFQLFNVHGVSDVRQTEKHTAEPLVIEPSAFEFLLAIENLKSRKSPGIDQIATEFIKAGGRTTHSAIHQLIISLWNKEKFPEEWKESIIVLIYKKDDKADCNNYRDISVTYAACP